MKNGFSTNFKSISNMKFLIFDTDFFKKEQILSNALYTCTCDDDHYGTNCELERPCAASPCSISGSNSSVGVGGCENSADNLDYTCACRDGWSGKDCQIVEICRMPELNPETGYASACQNNGTCIGTNTTCLLYTSPSPRD